MVTFLGFSDSTCALIICAIAGINCLNACVVARYARRRGHVTTDCGTALVFFISLCFGTANFQPFIPISLSNQLCLNPYPPSLSGMFSWVIFCCEPDSQPGVNVNGVRVISVPAPLQQPSYGYYQQFNNPTEYSMQGQYSSSYQPPPLAYSHPPHQQQPPAPYFVQQPPATAVHAWSHNAPAGTAANLLQASAPPMEE